MNNERFFTTVEIIEELNKDRTKKFKRVHDGLVISAPKGDLTWESGHDFLSLSNDEWYEIDNSVNFIEAFKSGKRVRVERKYIELIEDRIFWTSAGDGVMEIATGILAGRYYHITTVLKLIQSHLSPHLISEILTTGKWYVEGAI